MSKLVDKERHFFGLVGGGTSHARKIERQREIEAELGKVESKLQ